MRRTFSLTFKIVVWCSIAIVLSLAAFISMYRYFSVHVQPYVESMIFTQRDDAISAYQHGGSGELRAYLSHLHGSTRFPSYLIDAEGRDLVDGTDRSDLLAKKVRLSGKGIPFPARSSDGRFIFISVVTLPSVWAFVPFYLLVLGTVVVLGWIVAVSVARPLRNLADTVNRFGRGDLNVRLRLDRKDEIGGVAQSFDTMADRIETLLNAERQLLQDISHELRSPLARLSFAAALTRTASDRDAAAGAVQKEIDRLAELVSGLLEMTRLEGDLTVKKKKPISLEQLLRQVIRDCDIEAKAREEHLHCELAAAPVVYGDYELIRRAIENVVRNAISYSPVGSTILISADQIDSEAVICVRDFGPGVSNSALGRLFNPFFRADQARTPSTGSLGLGLTIARRAIALHSGEIRAENANPGLLVRIELPV